MSSRDNPPIVEFSQNRHHLRFDERGIQVESRLMRWADVGALGILENAARRGFGGVLGSNMPGIRVGCLGVCLKREVQVVPAFALTLECVGDAPTAKETADAIRFLRTELTKLWEYVPVFAPPLSPLEDWWREQVYGPESHAHTDADRVRELRAELQKMREDLDR